MTRPEPKSEIAARSNAVLCVLYCLLLFLLVEFGNGHLPVPGWEVPSDVKIVDADFTCGRQKVTGRLDFFASDNKSLCGTFPIDRKYSGHSVTIPIREENPYYTECFAASRGENNKFHLVLKTPCGVFSNRGTCCENWFYFQVFTKKFMSPGLRPHEGNLTARIEKQHYEQKCWGSDSDQEVCSTWQ